MATGRRPSVPPASAMAEPDAPRVLVVDDELQILRALRVVLREAGL